LFENRCESEVVFIHWTCAGAPFPPQSAAATTIAAKSIFFMAISVQGFAGSILINN